MKPIDKPLPLIPLLLSPVLLLPAVVSAGGFEYALDAAAAWQYQEVSSNSPSKSTGRGGYTIQPALTYQLSESVQGGEQLAGKVGFSVDNGLPGLEEGFILASWDIDFEDDAKEINGRNRDYLFTAWYRAYSVLSEQWGLDFSAGVLDATDYLDGNAYANDEFGQFMNQTFVNQTLGGLPSYDLGATLGISYNRMNLQLLAMDVGDDGAGDDGEKVDDYRYYAMEFGAFPAFFVGDGGYRLLVSRTSKSFDDKSGSGNKRVDFVGVSVDQALGEHWGLFSRLGWQSNDTEEDHTEQYTAGLSVNGGLWRRGDDRIGFAGGYLSSGTLETDESYLGELYYLFQATDSLSLTFDLQYQRNRYGSGHGSGNQGFITGARGTLGF